MKTAKKLATALLLICLVGGLFGCGARNLKDNILDGYNQWLQFSSKHALTNKNILQGERKLGEDAYVGNYSATYEDFDGEEYIFGATGLKRETDNELTVAYTLKITSGSVSLLWIHSGIEYTITDTESEDTFEISIGSGDNYIVLKGEDFSGSLELEVK